MCCRSIGDKTPSSIKLLSKQFGNVKQEFHTAGKRPWPNCIAHCNHKFFVTSCNQERKQLNFIEVYGENGAFLYKFGEKGEGDGQFHSLCGLAVYGGDMLLACDGGNHRVQLLTQEGHFVTSFGSYGSDPGKIVGPIDAVVTPNGDVLVLELGGKRVQVWR